MSSRTDEEIRNQKLILGVTTTLLVLCYFLYFLRILSRKLLKTPLWIDDWFMLFALFVCTGMSILNYVGVAYGSGVHRYHLQASEYRSFQINLYVFMMSWALGAAVVKVGILLFYWRVFIVRDFRRIIAMVGAIVLASSISIFIVFMVQCNPIPRFWADTEDGYCINQIAFYLSGGSLNIASDVLVLSLPIRQVWKLNAPLNQRIALVFLFCLGGFVCGTSIARIISINKIDPEDFSYTNVGGGLWSTAEVQLGFICANLPHTQHLLTRCFQGWRPRTSAWRRDSGPPSADDYRNSPTTRTQPRRDTVGFQNLGSQSKSIGTVKAAAAPAAERYPERGDSCNEEASIGAYESDHELISMGTPCKSGGVGRVEVRTEVRQEVHYQENLRALARAREQGAYTVSTGITAKGTRL